MDNQNSTSSDEIDFPDERKYADTIAKANDSQPTKAKVAAFKSRVFKLIKIYTEKSQNLNPLLESLNPQIFSREPQRMNQIVLLLLNKQPNMTKVYLSKLLEIYKILLLYKTKNQDSKINETFIRILKKALEDGGEQVVNQMVEKVFTKRNCKLNVAFFQYLCRKIPATKSIILEKCNELKEGKKLRPAQLKQIDKLRSKISKHKPQVVKKEEIQEVDE